MMVDLVRMRCVVERIGWSFLERVRQVLGSGVRLVVEV